MALESPKRFQSKWSKRLESWAREVRRRADRLTDRNGSDMPMAFSLIDQAMDELTACGAEAVELEGEGTREVLTHACCSAVAAAVDRRMYRLSNAETNHHTIESGTHKPPH